MASSLPSSGPLSLVQIGTFFNGPTPYSLRDYYRGGAYVPDVPANANIPTSGTIKISDFYGAEAGLSSYSVDIQSVAGSVHKPAGAAFQVFVNSAGVITVYMHGTAVGGTAVITSTGGNLSSTSPTITDTTSLSWSPGSSTYSARVVIADLTVDYDTANLDSSASFESNGTSYTGPATGAWISVNSTDSEIASAVASSSLNMTEALVQSTFTLQIKDNATSNIICSIQFQLSLDAISS
jgi:hypothetical protein